MNKHQKLKLFITLLAFGLPFILSSNVFAQRSGNLGPIENVLRNIMQVSAGLSCLIATGFFVVGGFGYITSSGNPENLERSKRTLIFSATGLAITIGAFVLSGIISDIASKAFGN